MKSTRLLLLFALLSPGIDGASAQSPAASPDDAPPAPPTLQERMQRGVSKQLESAAKMQTSVDKQKQVSQRQTGQPAESGFFALPKPASLGGPVYHLPRPQAVEPDAAVTDEKSLANELANEKPGTEREEKGAKEDIPPPGLIPFDPALLEPLKPVAPIAPIPGIESPVKVTKGVKGTAFNSPKMEELLRGLGAQGLGVVPGLLRGQADSSTLGYSGLDKAPPTSFSLTDWLFGL